MTHSQRIYKNNARTVEKAIRIEEVLDNAEDARGKVVNALIYPELRGCFNLVL